MGKATLIKIELLKAGVTQRAIAASLGVGSVAVNNVIHGRGSSKRIEQAIADAVGKPVSELFPDRQANSSPHLV